MNGASPAHRVRHASIRIGVLVSAFIFALLGGRDLLDQWIGGYASATFMLGTALIYTGTCLAVFGIISPIGYALSTVLTDAVPYQN
jgi:hypothetical protein